MSFLLILSHFSSKFNVIYRTRVEYNFKRIVKISEKEGSQFTFYSRYTDCHQMDGFEHT